MFLPIVVVKAKTPKAEFGLQALLINRPRYRVLTFLPAAVPKAGCREVVRTVLALGLINTVATDLGPVLVHIRDTRSLRQTRK